MNQTAAVVVTYNRKELLRLCITKLLGQSGTSCDVIVIDNASTDGTAEMIHTEFKNMAVFYFLLDLLLYFLFSLFSFQNLNFFLLFYYLVFWFLFLWSALFSILYQPYISLPMTKVLWNRKLPKLMLN